MNKFDWFVMPFTLGLAFLVIVLLAKYYQWIKQLPISEKLKVKRGLFSLKSIKASWEVFMECLLHRKIFKVNPLLGYMHTSLAFGWFILIAAGNLESRMFYEGHMSPPYIPIFFRFFNPHPTDFHYERVFSFVMDLFLVIVLSGVALAWIKRMYSKMFGMKKTTQLQWGDKLALSTLWFIFPLRLLAESFTSAFYGGGSFLTANAGHFLGNIFPSMNLSYPLWWAYSFALGLFFVALPFSRYMHIPTEILLIFLKNYGVKEKKTLTSFTKVETNTCSRCGICIDTCQLASSANIKGVQTVYKLQNIRYDIANNEQTLNCLMCGRCDKICPVGIDINTIRQANRYSEAAINTINQPLFNYIPNIYTSKAQVLYFAGCMTHLQPGIKKSMVKILDAANIRYKFMDEDKSICCGRPLMLSGQKQQALEMVEKNKKIIAESGAKILVTSCPICYKIFKEEYDLSIEVLHHSEYLLRLAEEKQIELEKLTIKATYHDPCELGRGSGIYEQPRKLLNKTLNLQNINSQKENAVCCGGSLANFKISMQDRKKITADALKTLTVGHPDAIVTSCPLCKKTFSQAAGIQVLDIAEIVAKSLILHKPIKKHIKKMAEEAIAEEV